ncbi:MAG TPA: TetR/AcrR family transcriptional regulator C-terminal ligand-binding domain-containing protein, partial [Burkholderiaceae bacterium]|nr:TetR/AcrR family transcriptional regulator C-terminal ligand-binding domain-containing protein [Burkholderiaceae bacterium]
RFFYDAVVRPNMTLLATIVQRGVDRGEFRDVDVAAAVHVWMAPLVMKAIWAHSMQPCCPPEDVVEPDRYLRTHVDFVLRALAKRPPR